MFFEYSPYFYTITLVLQAICVIHCIRKGNQNKWIWIIVFLPLVGSIAYMFTEMFSKGDMENIGTVAGNIFNPGGTIRKLEKNLRFTDTFQNRVLLADAYLAHGRTSDAVQLYETSLTGNFTENEHVHKQLVFAYYEQQRFSDAVKCGSKIYNQPQFYRSRAHIYYALSLEKSGNIQKAEEELKKLTGHFSQYEARFQYAIFLTRNNRNSEAKEMLNTILREEMHLSSPEKRENAYWLRMAKQELNKIN